MTCDFEICHVRLGSRKRNCLQDTLILAQRRGATTKKRKEKTHQVSGHRLHGGVKTRQELSREQRKIKECLLMGWVFFYNSFVGSRNVLRTARNLFYVGNNLF